VKVTDNFFHPRVETPLTTDLEQYTKYSPVHMWD